LTKFLEKEQKVMKYTVNYMMQGQGWIEVEARSKEDAMEMVADQIMYSQPGYTEWGNASLIEVVEGSFHMGLLDKNTPQKTS
jgi:porphobilinogen deaminase